MLPPSGPNQTALLRRRTRSFLQKLWRFRVTYPQPTRVVITYNLPTVVTSLARPSLSASFRRRLRSGPSWSADDWPRRLLLSQRRRRHQIPDPDRVRFGVPHDAGAQQPSRWVVSHAFSSAPSRHTFATRSRGSGVAIQGPIVQRRQ